MMTTTLAGFMHPPANPLVLLQQWLEIADKTFVKEPRDLVLSTIEASGKPASRVVLITGCDEKGVTFGTSEISNKGKAISANPWVAGNLWWRETISQINFQGRVTQLSDERSDKMFQERPRAGQAVTVIATQSAPLGDPKNEADLRKKIFNLVNAQAKISRPEKWHAYHIALEMIEFWQGDEDRFHHRLRYDLINNIWQHQRLQP